jgi:hypothetical protein
VFNSSPLSLASSSGSILSFGTEFYFQTNSSACVEGDTDTDTCGSGFAFVIQSTSASARGAYGADNGFANFANPALGSSMGFSAIPGVQIEFDFRKSGIMNDSDGRRPNTVRMLVLCGDRIVLNLKIFQDLLSHHCIDDTYED